jgi:hypothetical protein
VIFLDTDFLFAFVSEEDEADSRVDAVLEREVLEWGERVETPTTHPCPAI